MTTKIEDDLKNKDYLFGQMEGLNPSDKSHLEKVTVGSKNNFVSIVIICSSFIGIVFFHIPRPFSSIKAAAKNKMKNTS